MFIPGHGQRGLDNMMVYLDEWLQDSALGKFVMAGLAIYTALAVIVSFVYLMGQVHLPLQEPLSQLAQRRIKKNKKRKKLKDVQYLDSEDENDNDDLKVEKKVQTEPIELNELAVQSRVDMYPEISENDDTFNDREFTEDIEEDKESEPSETLTRGQSMLFRDLPSRIHLNIPSTNEEEDIRRPKSSRDEINRSVTNWYIDDVQMDPQRSPRTPDGLYRSGDGVNRKPYTRKELALTRIKAAMRASQTHFYDRSIHDNDSKPAVLAMSPVRGDEGSFARRYSQHPFLVSDDTGDVPSSTISRRRSSNPFDKETGRYRKRQSHRFKVPPTDYELRLSREFRKRRDMHIERTRRKNRDFNMANQNCDISSNDSNNYKSEQVAASTSQNGPNSEVQNDLSDTETGVELGAETRNDSLNGAVAGSSSVRQTPLSFRFPDIIESTNHRLTDSSQHREASPEVNTNLLAPNTVAQAEQEPPTEPSSHTEDTQQEEQDTLADCTDPDFTCTESLRQANWNTNIPMAKPDKHSNKKDRKQPKTQCHFGHREAKRSSSTGSAHKSNIGYNYETMLKKFEYASPEWIRHNTDERKHIRRLKYTCPVNVPQHTASVRPKTIKVDKGRFNECYSTPPKKSRREMNPHDKRHHGKNPRKNTNCPLTSSNTGKTYGEYSSPNESPDEEDFPWNCMPHGNDNSSSEADHKVCRFESPVYIKDPWYVSSHRHRPRHISNDMRKYGRQQGWVKKPPRRPFEQLTGPYLGSGRRGLVEKIKRERDKMTAVQALTCIGQDINFTAKPWLTEPGESAGKPRKKIKKDSIHAFWDQENDLDMPEFPESDGVQDELSIESSDNDETQLRDSYDEQDCCYSSHDDTLCNCCSEAYGRARIYQSAGGGDINSTDSDDEMTCGANWNGQPTVRNSCFQTSSLTCVIEDDDDDYKPAQMTLLRKILSSSKSDTSLTNSDSADDCLGKGSPCAKEKRKSLQLTYHVPRAVSTPDVTQICSNPITEVNVGKSKNKHVKHKNISQPKMKTKLSSPVFDSKQKLLSRSSSVNKSRKPPQKSPSPPSTIASAPLKPASIPRSGQKQSAAIAITTLEHKPPSAVSCTVKSGQKTRIKSSSSTKSGQKQRAPPPETSKPGQKTQSLSPPSIKSGRRTKLISLSTNKSGQYMATSPLSPFKTSHRTSLLNKDRLSAGTISFSSKSKPVAPNHEFAAGQKANGEDQTVICVPCTVRTSWRDFSQNQKNENNLKNSNFNKDSFKPFGTLRPSVENIFADQREDRHVFSGDIQEQANAMRSSGLETLDQKESTSENFMSIQTASAELKELIKSIEVVPDLQGKPPLPLSSGARESFQRRSVQTLNDKGLPQEETAYHFQQANSQVSVPMSSLSHAFNNPITTTEELSTYGYIPEYMRDTCSNCKTKCDTESAEVENTPHKHFGCNHNNPKLHIKGEVKQDFSTVIPMREITKEMNTLRKEVLGHTMNRSETKNILTSDLKPGQELHDLRDFRLLTSEPSCSVYTDQDKTIQSDLTFQEWSSHTLSPPRINNGFPLSTSRDFTNTPKQVYDQMSIQISDNGFNVNKEYHNEARGPRSQQRYLQPKMARGTSSPRSGPIDTTSRRYRENMNNQTRLSIGVEATKGFTGARIKLSPVRYLVYRSIPAPKCSERLQKQPSEFIKKASVHKYPGQKKIIKGHPQASPPMRKSNVYLSTTPRKTPPRSKPVSEKKFKAPCLEKSSRDPHCDSLCDVYIRSFPSVKKDLVLAQLVSTSTASSITSQWQENTISNNDAPTSLSYESDLCVSFIDSTDNSQSTTKLWEEGSRSQIAPSVCLEKTVVKRSNFFKRMPDRDSSENHESSRSGQLWSTEVSGASTDWLCRGDSISNAIRWLEEKAAVAAPEPKRIVASKPEVYPHEIDATRSRRKTGYSEKHQSTEVKPFENQAPLDEELPGCNVFLNLCAPNTSIELNSESICYMKIVPKEQGFQGLRLLPVSTQSKYSLKQMESKQTQKVDSGTVVLSPQVTSQLVSSSDEEVDNLQTRKSALPFLCHSRSGRNKSTVCYKQTSQPKSLMGLSGHKTAHKQVQVNMDEETKSDLKNVTKQNFPTKNCEVEKPKITLRTGHQNTLFERGLSSPGQKSASTCFSTPESISKVEVGSQTSLSPASVRDVSVGVSKASRATETVRSKIPGSRLEGNVRPPLYRKPNIAQPQLWQTRTRQTSDFTASKKHLSNSMSPENKRYLNPPENLKHAHMPNQNNATALNQAASISRPSLKRGLSPRQPAAQEKTVHGGLGSSSPLKSIVTSRCSSIKSVQGTATNFKTDRHSGTQQRNTRSNVKTLQDDKETSVQKKDVKRTSCARTDPTTRTVPPVGRKENEHWKNVHKSRIPVPIFRTSSDTKRRVHTLPQHSSSVEKLAEDNGNKDTCNPKRCAHRPQALPSKPAKWKETSRKTPKTSNNNRSKSNKISDDKVYCDKTFGKLLEDLFLDKHFKKFQGSSSSIEHEHIDGQDGKATPLDGQEAVRAALTEMESLLSANSKRWINGSRSFKAAKKGTPFPVIPNTKKKAQSRCSPAVDSPAKHPLGTQNARPKGNVDSKTYSVHTQARQKVERDSCVSIKYSPNRFLVHTTTRNKTSEAKKRLIEETVPSINTKRRKKGSPLLLTDVRSRYRVKARKELAERAQAWKKSSRGKKKETTGLEIFSKTVNPVKPEKNDERVNIKQQHHETTALAKTGDGNRDSKWNAVSTKADLQGTAKRIVKRPLTSTEKTEQIAFPCITSPAIAWPSRYEYLCHYTPPKAASPCYSTSSLCILDTRDEVSESMLDNFTLND